MAMNTKLTLILNVMVINAVLKTARCVCVPFTP